MKRAHEEDVLMYFHAKSAHYLDERKEKRKGRKKQRVIKKEIKKEEILFFTLS